jgi:O-antigen/teichoic acid export membrane protein
VVNTIYRGVAEIVGRMASLLLFAVAARTVGQAGLGAFVFGIAFVQLVMLPVNLGLDRYLLRVTALEHQAADRLFFNVLALKLVIAAPAFAVALLALHFASYNHLAQALAWSLVPGTMADSTARSQLAVFSAHERAGPPAIADAFQRVCSAALGILGLKLGYGAIVVGISYSAGSVIGVIAGFVLLARTVGVPARRVSRRVWRALAAASIQFGVQDFFAAMLARVDTLMLSLIATQAAVGRYGAAYRLFESTFLVAIALAGAFSAMYTYLDRHTSPPLGIMFERSLKLGFVSLMPVAVAFTALGAPICRLIYGPSFATAGVPLQILGPGVVLYCVVDLTVSLRLAREDPGRMVPLAAAMAAINIALNLILIPRYGDGGAAAAMVFTLAVYSITMGAAANRVVGGLHWVRTCAGPVCAAAAMAGVTLALRGSVWTTLGAGLAVYLGTLVVIERLVSPVDVASATQMLRRLLPTRSPG